MVLGLQLIYKGFICNSGEYRKKRNDRRKAASQGAAYPNPEGYVMMKQAWLPAPQTGSPI